MANRIKSGIKRVQIAERNRQYNMAIKSEIKTRIKHVRTTITKGEGDAAEMLKIAESTIDKAARKGVIHRNTAARRKARLAKAVAKA